MGKLTIDDFVKAIKLCMSTKVEGCSGCPAVYVEDDCLQINEIVAPIVTARVRAKRLERDLKVAKAEIALLKGAMKTMTDQPEKDTRKTSSTPRNQNEEDLERWHLIGAEALNDLLCLHKIVEDAAPLTGCVISELENSIDVCFGVLAKVATACEYPTIGEFMIRAALILDERSADPSKRKYINETLVVLLMRGDGSHESIW